MTPTQKPFFTAEELLEESYRIIEKIVLPTKEAWDGIADYCNKKVEELEKENARLRGLDAERLTKQMYEVTVTG